MEPFLITPSAGKRLIAQALASYDVIKEAIETKTLVIVAGTTNGYVAEEILTKIDQIDGFKKKRFFRGLVIPPGHPITKSGRLPDENGFPGDVVLVEGVWQKGMTIFDVVNELKEGDIILKGANALDLSHRQAGVLIGDPYGGTIGAALQAVVGRRIRLIHPVGLEKRVLGNLNELSRVINTPGVQGPRLLPTPGEVFTEIEAIYTLTGAKANLIAGGGVNGAEGSLWLAVSGTDKQVESAEKLLKSVSGEPNFYL
jgi:hypothetical protein